MTHRASDYHAVVTSPVGPLGISVDAEGALHRIDFLDTPAQGTTRSPAPAARAVCQQLEEYFAGERRDFELTLRPHGTDFQQAVWVALCEIPYGGTVSYKQIAERVGRPRAMRAVGGANGANPIPIVIPCHRVIAGDGGLGGYSSGLDRKRWLLALEAEVSAPGLALVGERQRAATGG